MKIVEMFDMQKWTYMLTEISDKYYFIECKFCNYNIISLSLWKCICTGSIQVYIIHDFNFSTDEGCHDSWKFWRSICSSDIKS